VNNYENMMKKIINLNFYKKLFDYIKNIINCMITQNTISLLYISQMTSNSNINHNRLFYTL